MKEYYVKVKPCCDNCAYECGIQFGPKERLIWYCSKYGPNSPIPNERKGCNEFEFDNNILRPTIVRGDSFVKNKEE